MIRFLMRGDYILRAATIVIAAALASPAYAQTANVTPDQVNVINLLSPFLSLNSTLIGQQTLTDNLDQASVINQNASPLLLNNYYSTPVLGALAINDENSLGAISTQLYGTNINVGPAANIAGALPQQATGTYAQYNGQQPQGIGAFGSVLGQLYVTAVTPGSSTLPNTISLLTTAFGFLGNPTSTTGDSTIAKFYFANGTINGSIAAVAPAGYTLPTSGGLPNKTNSVYDTAYGVSNTQPGQNALGDSHPYQTLPVNSLPFTFYDPTVKTATTVTGAVHPDSPSSNPSFPSSHMAYATTDGLLLGMLAPQLYQSTLLRMSEIGESRIVVGVHYPLDIIASRSYVSYDLAQYLSNPTYINNAAVTGTAVNLPSLFTAAQGEMQTVLGPAAAAAGCGTSFATCATSSANVNPYAPSYVNPNAPPGTTNAQVYAARLTYGLPTLTFAAAPQESAPAGGPDASILLATLYGGSTTAAQTLAPTGGIYGNLSTSTINQIIVNTETNALSAFYGTSLSYWSRINLYDAAGYFGGVTGTLTLASGDQVNTNVVVAGASTNVNGDVVPAGVLAGYGSITGNVTVTNGGTISPGDGPGIMTITGNYTQAAGGIFDELIVGPPTAGAGSSYSQLDVSGLVSLDGKLDITTENGFTLTAGEVFAIITFGSESGDFASLYLNGNECSLISSDLWSCGLYQFGLVDPSGTLDLVVDAAPTPLPSTWTMMLIGLAGLGFVGYRQSRKGVLTAAV